MAASVLPASQGRGNDFAVGTSIPPATPHAVSVSLPRWQDNIDYEEGRLTNVMETGYPRFFIHKIIQKLAKVLLSKLGQPATLDSEAEDCLLVPSKRVADSCRDFMQIQHEKQGKGQLSVREVHFCLVLPYSGDGAGGSSILEEETRSASSSLPKQTIEDASSSQLSIHIVLFPKSAFPIAKSFWQHTGDGISSRMAAACLDLLERKERLDGYAQKTPGNRSREGSVGSTAPTQLQESPSGVSTPTSRTYSRNRHYARGGGGTGGSSSSAVGASSTSTPSVSVAPSPRIVSDAEIDTLCSDDSTYVEERYGRNMALVEAPRAKRALRKRIAGVASDEFNKNVDIMQRNCTGESVNEEDVYLYPTGMSAIFHAHQLAMAVRKEKSVCFGFPYLDTLKILEKWGPGCFFLGHGDEDDLQRLETLLQSQKITALFCEFPSNPLLRSPNLQRIRELADQHDFLVVIDETIGNFVNVCVLPYADIVVSSLTKIFTGEANGMGGSLVLNSQGPRYKQLKQIQEQEYEDNFFNQNAVFLERNSRDFVQRVRRIESNAIKLIEMLCKAKEGAFGQVIKKIYYPTLMTPENYNRCRRPDGGYGELLSITFTSIRASAAFYDALRCAKGPSLGTNFTLASPFVILAHYGELDWAASYGVEANLVRIAVGLEDGDYLVEMVTNALRAAKEEVTSSVVS